MNNLENMELTPDRKPALARKKDGTFSSAGAGGRSESSGADDEQLDIMDASAHPVIVSLRTLDINALTPIDALNVLHELRGKAL